MMSLAQKYKKSLTQKWSLRFKVKRTGDNYDGVVMMIRPTFIVLQELTSFYFDGIIILPKKVISGYRDNQFDRCKNEIIRQNRAINKLSLPKWLQSCQSVPQILIEMMERGIWPAIESVSKDKPGSALYLGQVDEVGNVGLYIYCYDAAGKWEKEYYLSYQNIIKIELNSDYCKNFNRYMKSKFDK